MESEVPNDAQHKYIRGHIMNFSLLDRGDGIPEDRSILLEFMTTSKEYPLETESSTRVARKQFASNDRSTNGLRGAWLIIFVFV